MIRRNIITRNKFKAGVLVIIFHILATSVGSTAQVKMDDTPSEEKQCDCVDAHNRPVGFWRYPIACIILKVLFWRFWRASYYFQEYSFLFYALVIATYGAQLNCRWINHLPDPYTTSIDPIDRSLLNSKISR